MLDAPILVDLLAKERRLNDLAALGVAAVNAQGYWFAKMKMGRIEEEAMTAVLQAVVDVQIGCARAFAAAGRRDEASSALDILERVVGDGPLADNVRALRARLLGA